MSITNQILPKEIWGEILKLLPGDSLYQKRRVSKIFFEIINNYIKSLIPDCFKDILKKRTDNWFVLGKSIILKEAVICLKLGREHALQIVYQEKVKDTLKDYSVTTELIFINQKLTRHRRNSFCHGEEKKDEIESLNEVITSLNEKIDLEL